MAEQAVAKHVGLYWGNHVNRFGSGDVADMEVRWSPRKDLKVKDGDNGVVISVTGLPPTFIINGWIMASDAKRPEWKRDFNNWCKPAYFVPLENLNPMETLNQEPKPVDEKWVTEYENG